MWYVAVGYRKVLEKFGPWCRSSRRRVFVAEMLKSFVEIWSNMAHLQMGRSTCEREQH